MKPAAAFLALALLGACVTPATRDGVPSYCEDGAFADRLYICLEGPDHQKPRYRTATRTVETVLPRGVADGSAPGGNNLTSMGTAVSDGATILRIRSTGDQTVELRRAGGSTVSFAVGRGDTFVDVEGPGTYIATFENGDRRTKSTGGHAFNDVRTETRTVRERKNF